MVAHDTVNPYRPGEPVAEPGMLFGRQNAADWLEQQILSGNARTLIFSGLPLIGKTSFVRHIAALQNFQAINLLVSLAQIGPGRQPDADTSTQPTINDLLQAVINQLIPQLTALNLIHSADLEPLPQTASILHKLFVQANQQLEKTRLILAFDDLHCLYSDDMALVAGFLSSLTPLLDECPQLHLVFAINQDKLSRLSHPLLDAAPTFTLGPLTTDAALNMVTQPVKNILRYDYGITKRIVEVNSHHPYYLTLFCHTLLNRQIHDGWVNQRDFDSALAEILDSPIDPFTQIWEQATWVERAVLSGMATIPGAHGPLTRQEVARFLQRHHHAIASHTVEDALESLAKRGVLVPMGAISYRFHVELLRLWLREHTRLEEIISRVNWSQLASQPKPSPEAVAVPPPARSPVQAPRRRRLWQVALALLVLLCGLSAAALVASRYFDLPLFGTIRPTPTLEAVIFEIEPPVVNASTPTPTATPVHTPTPTPALVMARTLPAITFMAREADQGWRIYVMNADGSGVTALTPPDEDSTAPVWSPDGQKIAYVSQRDGNREIYVIPVPEGQGQVNADGGNAVNITRHPADDWTPSWSPDGSKIAFSSLRSGGWEIYVVDTACLDAAETCPDMTTQITNNGNANILPVWSPDGSRLAFNSKATGNWDLFTMNAGGTDIRQVTRAAENDLSPAWSPDGAMIAFETNRDGNVEVYVINADGSAPRNISNMPQANDHGPIWTPDGQQLVFYSNREGNWDIFTTTLDGETVVNLTNTPDRDEQTPAWRP